MTPTTKVRRMRIHNGDPKRSSAARATTIERRRQRRAKGRQA